VPVVHVFRHPWAVTVDRLDNLYVADSGFNRVMKLNAAGQWVLSVPSGQRLGETQNPSCVSVDTLNDLYVIDGGRRLQKRDRKGRWSILAQTAGPDDGVYEMCAGPGGVAYVSSYIHGQLGIQMPDSHGGWTMVAPMGTGLGQVRWPLGIASDAIGRLYIADVANQRVQVRDVDGQWLLLASGAEAGLVNSFGPASIAIDHQGAVFVAALPGVFRWTPQPQPKSTP
jgi:sugar lactone lactonase YvrE